MSKVNYTLGMLIKLSYNLDNNLKAIEAITYYRNNTLDLYCKGLLLHKDYQKIKNVCSKEMNKLHNDRLIMLENKARSFREAYKEKCRLSKITVNHKVKLVSSALNKLTLEEREVLKEYSFKL